MLDNYKHYMVDGQMMSAKEMRSIVEEVLEYGAVAYHIPMADIVRILKDDGRTVTIL